MSDILEYIAESELSSKTLAANDKVRVVGSDTDSYAVLLSTVCAFILSTYAGTTLAGTAQSVKSAIDALSTAITNEVSTRGSADTTLQTNINTEAAARAAADGTLSNLTTQAKNNLVAAVNELKTLITTEATTRSTNDGDLTALETTVKTSLVAALNELKDALTQLDKYDLLLLDDIPGATMTLVRNSDNEVTQITYTKNSTTIRTDVYTRTSTTFTDTRTLNTGEVMTLVTTLATGSTTVTYTPAS